jgi:hypothetical protein
VFNLIYRGTSPIFQEQNGLPLVIGMVEFGERSQNMTVKRMDNVLIVVDDLEATKAFFIELGL